MPENEHGFTLIEIIIVIAIVGILAAVAYPSYQNHALESRRAEAHAAILSIQLAEESWRASHKTYTNDMSESGLNIPSNSDKGFYALEISSASTSGYKITATALGAQEDDTGCTKIELVKSSAGENKTPSACW